MVGFVSYDSNSHGWLEDILDKPTNTISKGIASLKHPKYQPSMCTHRLVVSQQLSTKNPNVFLRFNLAFG